MSAEVTIEQVSSDGVRKMFRKGPNGEGPRPIDDEDLAAVAGGATYNVTFDDGCSMTVSGAFGSGAAGFERAAEEAQDAHTNLMGHTHTQTTVTQI